MRTWCSRRVRFAEKGRHRHQSGRDGAIRQAGVGPVGRERIGLAHHGRARQRHGAHSLPYETTQDIQTEIRKLLPGYYNLGQPQPVAADPTTYLRNGYQDSVGARYAVNGHAQGSGRPYGLKLIQLIYHSGKLSTKASGLMDIFAEIPARLRMSLEECETVGRCRWRARSRDLGSGKPGVECGSRRQHVAGNLRVS